MRVITRAVKQVKNEKNWPSEYVVNFLEPGLISYEDVGAGIAQLKKETILKFMQSFVGKPVVIDHVDVTPKDFKEHAVGYVTKVWYDDYTNWACCSFLLTDDKAKDKVARGYSVSCAYDVTGTGPGGEWHAIKFDEEITDGIGTHLALVTSPRYEECKIQPCTMLVNSKKAKITEGEGKKLNVYFSCNVGDHVRFRMRDDKPSMKGEIVNLNQPQGEPLQIYTVRAENGLTYELKVKDGTPQNFSTLVRENKQKEDSKMSIKLFRKANDKAGAEVDPKDPAKQKWNAEHLFVQVENEMVPLTELAKLANSFEEVQTVENEVEIDGKVYNVADLASRYLASKKNADEIKKKEEEEAEKNKKNGDEGKKEIEKGEGKEEGAEKTVVKKNEEDKDDEEKKKMKKENETEEEKKAREEKEKEDAKKNDEEKEKEKQKEEAKQEKEEETIKRNEKKDIKHFVSLNSARERGGNASVMILDTLHNRVERGKERYGTTPKV